MPSLIEPSLAASSPEGITPKPGANPQPVWLNVVSHLDPKYGGLSAAVPALSSAIAQAGVYSIALTGFCQAKERFSPSVSAGVAIEYMPAGRLEWFSQPGARSEFRKLVREAAGVHIHGLWQLSTSAAADASRKAHKPYLISAHGMLEAWALANKGLKKKLYASLIERANLRSADCLHALTEAEARDYRHFGLDNPIAIIPNGVRVPVGCSPEPFLSRFPELKGKQLVLFLSRIHFKKGLDILCQAWSRVSKSCPEAQLVLAGPDFEGTQTVVEKLIDELGIRPSVTFTGMLGPELKWSALAAAGCFVLPSYSEGLSVSVLEAMGMGMPVVITEQCNLPEVRQHGCGWTIEPQADQLESALLDALHTPVSERTAIGNRGRDLVARRYGWPAIGEQMSALYRWLDGGSLPGTVDLRLKGSI